MSETFNPRAVVGDNLGVDQAQIVHDRLSLDYAESAKTLKQLRAEAAVLKGVKIASDDEALIRGSVIKKLRDLDNRLEAFREAEKQPFLRGGNAVDNYFFGMRDQIARRKPGDRSVKPGDADILQADINEWQNAKDAAKRARLERERLEAARIAREHAAALRKAQEEADEAARAAARARSPGTQQAKTQIAMDMADREADAKAAADLAAEQAKEAQLATLVKPADLTRVRGADGVMLTTAREPYAILTDRALVDIEALRPYFTDFEIEKAIRGWAKATGHKVQMAGAEIGFRNKGVTR